MIDMKTFVHERISDLPLEDRPRERLAARGVTALSDIELLSLMLGSGSSRKGVGRLALDLLSVLDGSGDIPDVGELTAVEGIGPARGALVAASLEFARRRLRPARRRISEPIDVLPLVTHWSDRPQEHFLVLSLNGAHEVLRLRVVSRGILDRTIVHPREVFVDPLSDRAAAIVCAHNHPSGNIEPSPEDRELTRRLKESGELLGIPLLDHVIFAENGYYSFLENGSL
jgi:DNA repair protein RadC